MDHYSIETKCVQAGWEPKNGEPRVLPIYQSTTFKYESAQAMGDLFDLKTNGFFYSRLANPTVDAVEKKIAALEGGVGAMLCSSGQMAVLSSIMNIANSGDHVISSSNIYGGTYNLFNKTLRGIGIDVEFVDPKISEEDLNARFKENTRLVFGETVANPSLEVLDLEKFIKCAHAHDVPFFIDNTFPTPINCRPIEWGADVVIHSTTKYMDGHAVSLGGCIVDSGKFNWRNGKFPCFTEPDETYHGTVYADAFGDMAFIVKARTHIMRDIGGMMSPENAFLLNLGLETLHLRMERHCSNAMKVAQYLKNHEKVTWVTYHDLPDSPQYPLVQKYLPKGTCGVVSFGVQGGREAAVTFMDALRLAAIVTHVADARTCVLHPASATHRQLSDQQLEEAGIPVELLRFSVGIEDPVDIIADLEQALQQI